MRGVARIGDFSHNGHLASSSFLLTPPRWMVATHALRSLFRLQGGRALQTLAAHAPNPGDEGSVAVNGRSWEGL